MMMWKIMEMLTKMTKAMGDSGKPSAHHYDDVMGGSQCSSREWNQSCKHWNNRTTGGAACTLSHQYQHHDNDHCDEM